jgi:hypothetical protein
MPEQSRAFTFHFAMVSEHVSVKSSTHVSLKIRYTYWEEAPNLLDPSERGSFQFHLKTEAEAAFEMSHTI